MRRIAEYVTGPDPVRSQGVPRFSRRTGLTSGSYVMAHRMVCRAPKPLGGAVTSPVSQTQVREPRPPGSAPSNGASSNGAHTNGASHQRRVHARPLGLHPGVGRRARARGRRRARVPRRAGLVQRRLPRRRRVLRAQRLPDHVRAARRVATERRRPRAGALLLAPSSPSAPRAARDDRGHVRVRGRVPPGRSVEVAGWRGRVVRLRHELVPDLPPAVVLLQPRAAADAPASVVAGDRGAVLPAVAAAPGPGAEVLATVARQAGRHHPRRRRRVGAPHGVAVPRRW